MTTLFDPTGDFTAIVDNLVTVTLALRNGLSYAVTAHQNQVRTTQHTPAGGDVKQGDVIWQFDVDGVRTSGGSSSGIALEGITEIPLGSTITDTVGNTWTILSASLQVWSSKWECQTRNLAVEARLDTIATLQVANATKDDHTGEIFYEWTQVATGLRAKFQLQDQPLEVEHDRDETEQLYQITLATGLTVDPGADYRILDASGNIYMLISYNSPDQIDQLPSITARRV